jgi:7,8-dihydroneopterin aldolase/epimerase/oxygenase
MKSSGPSELGVVMRQGGFIRRPNAPVENPDAASVPASNHAVTTKIFIKGLQIEAECGVYAFEKGTKRPLIVDIDVIVASDLGALNDSLAQTVDYDTLAAHVRDVAAVGHLNLIETFAEQVANRILGEPRILSVRLRVEKPGSVPGADCSGVEIERTR